MHKNINISAIALAKFIPYTKPMTATITQPSIDTHHVLGKAVSRAANRMGIRQPQLSEIIGRDRSSITRSGIDPESKPGELALLMIRCYRSLAVLVDDNPAQIDHWLSTHNHHTRGVPREQLNTVQGLVAVTEYLDAVRGKL